MKNFTLTLINWYELNKRDLPWRKTRNPYLIWISEIIFQQTRINQGFDYYTRFVKAFPDVKKLAEADESLVLKQWQGLGYYSRARNLHKAAKMIIEQYHGVFPEDVKDIIKLPGIGEYTAAAIASFAFLQATPVIDGNVIRFISRLFGLETLFTSDNSKKELNQLLHTLIDLGRPDIFNNAIMEFGALQCKPASPDCNICVFKKDCFAFKSNKVGELPLKLKKKENPIIYLNYLVFLKKEKRTTYIWLNKRNEKGIWQNLYDFPCIESKKLLNIKQIQESNNFKSIVSATDYSFVESSKEFIHKLTHKTLITHFHTFQLNRAIPKEFSKYTKCKLEDIHNYPVPRLIEMFLETFCPE
jgi:A/G-specific adenine glycosylase